jgi:4-hydroxy-2-oxoglutarate aldolase
VPNGRTASAVLGTGLFEGGALMYKKELSGVFAPITTPFHMDGRLDLDGLKKNMSFYANSSLKGYLALGSNGENKSLVGGEKFQVLKAIVDNKGENQYVMAGCIAESTYETIEIAKKAESLGADFLTLLSPSYFKSQMTDDVLEIYFTEVADSVKTPCLVYCAPQFTSGITLSAALISKIAKHPNIVGIKDSSVGNIDNYLLAAPDDFAVIAGSANFFCTALIGGGTGGILSLANAFPQVTHELYKAFVAKDYETLFRLNKRLQKLNKSVSGKGGVSAVKAAMNLAGLVGGYPRRPLLPLNQRDVQVLEGVLKKENLIG